MKTKKLLFYSLFILSVVGLMSCSKPKNLSLIPEKALAVVKIDTKSLIQKSGLTDMSQFESFKSVEQQVSGKEKELLDKIKEDPSSVGIDFTKPIYIFSYTTDGSSRPQSAISIAMDDIDNFEKTIKELSSETIVQKGNFKTTASMQMAWNDDLIVMLPDYYGGKAEEEYTYLFGEREGLLDKNSDFKDFITDSNDISIWISGGLYDQALNDKKAFSYAKNSFTGTINFEDEEIVFKNQNKVTDSLAKVMEQYNYLKDEVSPDMLQYFPKNSFLTFEGNIDAKKFKDYLKNTLKDKYDFEKTFKEEKGIDLNQLVNGLEGNVVFSLIDISKQSFTPKPVLSSAIKVKDNTFYQSLPALFGENLIQKNGYYEIATGSVYDPNSAFVGTRDNMVYFTNDSVMIQQFLKNNLQQPTLKDNKIVTSLLDKPISMYINFDYNTMSPNMKSYIDLPVVQSFTKPIFNVLDHFEYVANDMKSGEGKLVLKNTEKNSLFTLLKAIDKGYASANKK